MCSYEIFFVWVSPFSKQMRYQNNLTNKNFIIVNILTRWTPLLTNN